MMNIFILLLIVGYSIHDIDGYGVRGQTIWQIILCKFSDSSTPKYTPTEIKEKFLDRGTGGLADYWHDISNGLINFNSSSVNGWYTISETKEQQLKKSRNQRFDDCVKASKLLIRASQRIIVITNPGIDLWGRNKQVYTAEDHDLTLIAHEMGHAYGLAHSFSDDPNYRNIDWAQIGEYDDEWDVMSAAHVKTTNTIKYGSAPPGLNGYGLERLGWIPLNRIYTFGKKGETSATLILTTLMNPASNYPLLIRIPFDPSDYQHYYLIEMRFKENWDAGFHQNFVFIHEIKYNPADKNYHSYLLRTHDTSTRQPVTSMNMNNVKITTGKINVQTRTISVYIESNIADRCLQGYVWREAISSDHVCVIPTIRSQTWADNAAADSRRNPSGGPFGVDTCKQGYVWREAYSSNDHVCVLPETRTQAQNDNNQAANRRNPSQFVYGPLTCRNGFVWREADNYDYVCVTPTTRKQTAADNAVGPLRRRPGHTCMYGYYVRNAYPNDYVCVSMSVLIQVLADNFAAISRWVFG
ncbi:unnamed protein product [Rotaria sordida]|uniref:Uncharacterized protein n=1 Tax=Rotaria sordida TaxID=392033 RepID=A0A815I5H8_9BILA|nr:unnamed protein product [Rotaria sordida]